MGHVDHFEQRERGGVEHGQFLAFEHGDVDFRAVAHRSLRRVAQVLGVGIEESVARHAAVGKVQVTHGARHTAVEVALVHHISTLAAGHKVRHIDVAVLVAAGEEAAGQQAARCQHDLLEKKFHK